MHLIWESSVNFIEVILFYIFVSQKLQLKSSDPRIKRKQYLFLIIRFLIVCVMNLSNLNSMYTLILSCILEIVFACIYYTDKLLYKIFIGLLYTVLCMLAEFIPFFCITTFVDIPADSLLSNGIFRIPVTTLYLTLIAVFVFLFRYMFNKETSASVMQRIIYSLISLTGIAVGHYILLTMVSCEIMGNEELAARLAIVNLLFMFLFVALLVFIYQLGISYNNSQRLLELQKIRALEEQEYHNIVEKITALRSMKHDMENHINSLEIMAQRVSSPEMQDYIKDLRTSIDSSQIFVSTGNMAVDCILSAKISLAKDSDIHTDFSVLLPDYFEMDAVVVCSILGNLWDNAIEACQNMRLVSPDFSPYINFYMKPYQDMTIIHIENSYSGIITHESDGTIKTLKASDDHGLGLKRIENLVGKEQGIMKIDFKNNIFSVHILIPQKEN